MEANILLEKDLEKIVMTYEGENGCKIKEKVKLRYMEKKTCYFSFALPIKFIKPKKRSTIDLVAYSDSGIYKTSVKLQDATVSFNEIIFEVSIPKNWEYTQRRIGSRKDIEVPLVIKFNDDFEIKTKSSNLSVGGVSFVVRQQISSIYKRPVTCSITIKFPKSVLINFDQDQLTVPAKILRCKEFGIDEIHYACSFVAIPPQVKETLKNYIMLYR